MTTPDKHSDNQKHPWTMQRILALIGIILLLAMYGSTMVFALIGSPNARGLLMGSIYLTIIIPVLLYATILFAGKWRGSGSSSDRDDDTDSE